MSTGWSRSKLSYSVSKSINEPALAQSSPDSASIISSEDIILPRLSTQSSPFLVSNSPFLVLTA
jgi:hypothetical protein